MSEEKKMVLVNVKIDADVLIPKSWLDKNGELDDDDFFGVGLIKNIGGEEKLFWSNYGSYTGQFYAYPNKGGVKAYDELEYEVIGDEE